MKKILFGFSLCLFVLVLFTGCFSKKVITAEQFKSKMEEKGLLVKDKTEEFSKTNYINKVYFAIDIDNTYEIEFYEMKDNSNAKSTFNDKKDAIESSNKVVSTKFENNGTNYNKLVITTSDKYILITRVKNTFLSVNVAKKNKSVIKDYVDYLGY